MSVLKYSDRIELSRLRLDKAKELILSAQKLYEFGYYDSSINRSYYAVFHAMRAVLVFDNVDNRKHSGVISEFRRRYIKSGILPAPVSKAVGKLFDARTHSDYDDFYFVDAADALAQLNDAAYVVNVIEKFLTTLNSK